MAETHGACGAPTDAAFTTASGETIWACPRHVQEVRRRQGPLTALFDQPERACSWTPPAKD